MSTAAELSRPMRNFGHGREGAVMGEFVRVESSGGVATIRALN